MNNHSIVVLNRDVEASHIPSGAPLFLQEGTEIVITQALGGSYTVNIYGNLALIDGKDADALGEPVRKTFTEADLENNTIEDLVWMQLKTCYDPEIPVNIVDLGLIYECLPTLLEDDTYHVNIKMTLTAPGCGMGPTIAGDVKRKILEIPRIKETNIDVVFDPPWSREMMSDAAKLELGIF